MKRTLIIVGTIILLTSNLLSQVIPERMSTKEQYDRCACYFNFDNMEFAISIMYDHIERNYTKEMFVIKSKTNSSDWKQSSDVLFQSDIYGSAGDRICIHQAWADNSFKSKEIINPKVNYGGNAQITIIDSTYILFTTKLYAKERLNNVLTYNSYPMLILLKYDNQEKYWKKIELKTFSYRPYETLVVKKINDFKYCIYDTTESCYVAIENDKIRIINN